MYDIIHYAADKTKYSAHEWCFFNKDENQQTKKHKQFGIDLIYWYLDLDSIVPKEEKKISHIISGFLALSMHTLVR